jgi:hypothetical protein
MFVEVERSDVYRWLVESLAGTRAEATRLSVDNPVVAHLTHILNIIRWKIAAGPRREISPEQRAEIILREGSDPGIPSAVELKRGQALAWDQWNLDGIWPEVERGFAVPSGRRAQQGYTQGSGRTRPPLFELMNAPADLPKRERRRRALKSAQPILDKPKVKELKHFAPELTQIFCAEFPGSHVKTAANRFILSFARHVHVPGADVESDTIGRGARHR